MKKDDYKTEFEEQRQEIGLEDDLPSRAELHRKGRKPKKKSSHMLINVILGLFTLIPVIILVYVISDFYNPEDSTSAKGSDANVQYEETGNKATDGKTDAKDLVMDEKVDEKKEDKKEGEDAGKVEVETPVTPEKKPEIEKKPEVEVKPEKKPVVNVNPTPEKKPEEKPEQKQVGKTHKVANGETLYRISVNYYGSDIGVEKIKSANGLSSNNIMVGQTLIIP